MQDLQVGDICTVHLDSGVSIPGMEVVNIITGQSGTVYYKVLNRDTSSHFSVTSDQILAFSRPAARRRGRPVGTPGGGRYGCKTKVVRVPEAVADNIADILAIFEDVKNLVDAWQEDIEYKSSPRYDQAKKLLSELRSHLGDK